MKVLNVFKKEKTSVQDLFDPGHVEPGFYVVSGTRQLVPLILDKLVDFLGLENNLPTHVPSIVGAVNRTDDRPGRRTAPTPALRSPKGVGGVGRFIWVDSGNVFDAYHVANAAARRGLSPVRVLRAIQVARPFTAFQYQQMLGNIPNPVTTMASRQGTVLQGGGQRLIPVVILSDLMSLFYDPEIQEGDLRRAFQEFRLRLSVLKKRAIVIGLHMNYEVPANRQSYLPQVLALSTRILSTRQRHLSLPTPSSFVMGSAA